jgi:thioredoxin reductase
VHTVFAAGDVAQYDRKLYFVLECKPGDSAVNIADGLMDYAIATTDAFMTALEAWES